MEYYVLDKSASEIKNYQILFMLQMRRLRNCKTQRGCIVITHNGTTRQYINGF